MSTISNPDDDKILFGDTKFLEEHPETKRWAIKIAKYSREYGGQWSEEVFSKILQDFPANRFLMPNNHEQWRPATAEEIKKRTRYVFENGGGKVTRRKRQKRKQSDLDGDAWIASPVPVGQKVYVYDELWPATVLAHRKDPVTDEEIVKVHWIGFSSKDDEWISNKQVLLETSENKTFLQKMDASADLSDDSDDDDDDSTVPTTPIRAGLAPSTSRRQVSPTSATPTVMSLTEDTTPVEFEKCLRAAKKKCKEIVKEANESDDFGTWKQGMDAEWAGGVIGMFSELPSIASLEHELQELRSKGLSGRMEAASVENRIDKLRKAQQHLAKAVGCLTELS